MLVNASCSSYWENLSWGNCMVSMLHAWHDTLFGLLLFDISQMKMKNNFAIAHHLCVLLLTFCICSDVKMFSLIQRLHTACYTFYISLHLGFSLKFYIWTLIIRSMTLVKWVNCSSLSVNCVSKISQLFCICLTFCLWVSFSAVYVSRKIMNHLWTAKYLLYT